MKLFFLIGCLLVGSMCAGQKTETPKIKILEPAAEEQLDSIRKKIEKSDIYFGSDLEQGYIIDINNDGKMEYVFVNHEGTMHCLNLTVFIQEGKDIKIVQMPFDIGTFENYYDIKTNKSTGRSQLFVQVDGNVYICTTDDYFSKTRDVHIWKDDKLSFACDSFWIKQQRAVFNNLYNESHFNAAYIFLENFEKKCRHLIDPLIDLWMRSDVALAAFKDHCPRTSLKIINELMQDTAYARATPALKKAVDHNADLCREALLNECTKGKYDYSWILLNAKESPHTFMSDAYEFDSLLNAVVPDVKPLYFHESNATWKDILKHYFTGPYGGKEVIADRYVICTGCVDHCCCSRAFLWCDTKEKVSVIASIPDCRQDENLMITSRSLAKDEIPKEFYRELKNWLFDCRNENQNEKNKIKKTCKDQNLLALFYDHSGAVFPVTF